MSKNNVPFRFDYVGSFLRPDYLKKARADFEKRNITKEELTEIENKAITDLVKKQKELGYKVITDGEFRRATWHLDFMWGFNGVAHKKTEKGVAFHGEPALIDDTWLTGKISVDNHPFVEHYKFIKTFEDENTVAKQTIPAPAQFFQQMIIPANIETTRKFYAPCRGKQKKTKKKILQLRASLKIWLLQHTFAEVTIIPHISQAVHMTQLQSHCSAEKMLTLITLNLMMSVQAALSL